MKASLISESMCVRVFVCSSDIASNLHGDDVPFSQAPAGIGGRGGGERVEGGGGVVQSVSQSSRTEKHQYGRRAPSPGVGTF